MKEKDLLECEEAYPSFERSRHNMLCSELKLLYVAITRTRQRLWICENTNEFSKPMFDYWTRKGLVQIKKFDNSLAQAMQVSSTKEEWKTQGLKLFDENNYEMATICFERAGDPTWESRCRAFGHKKDADRMRSSDPKKASMLREAAKIFDSIRQFESAAECLYDLGEYGHAGNIYLNKCTKYLTAAESYTLAGRYDLAADVYANKNLHSECLAACTKGKLIDEGLQFIECWKNASKETDLVIRNKEIDKMEQEFLKSLDDPQMLNAKVEEVDILLRDDLESHLTLVPHDWRLHMLERLECLEYWKDVAKDLAGNIFPVEGFLAALSITIPRPETSQTGTEDDLPVQLDCCVYLLDQFCSLLFRLRKAYYITKFSMVESLLAISLFDNFQNEVRRAGH